MGPRPRTAPPLVSLGLVLAGLLLAASAPAPAAEDIDFEAAPDSRQLRDLTRELGVSICPVTLTPASHLGLLGIDASVSATGTKIDGSADFWRIASRGHSQSGTVVQAL